MLRATQQMVIEARAFSEVRRVLESVMACLSADRCLQRQYGAEDAFEEMFSPSLSAAINPRRYSNT